MAGACRTVTPRRTRREIDAAGASVQRVSFTNSIGRGFAPRMHLGAICFSGDRQRLAADAEVQRCLTDLLDDELLPETIAAGPDRRRTLESRSWKPSLLAQQHESCPNATAIAAADVRQITTSGTDSTLPSARSFRQRGAEVDVRRAREAWRRYRGCWPPAHRVDGVRAVRVAQPVRRDLLLAAPRPRPRRGSGGCGEHRKRGQSWRYRRDDECCVHR